MSEAFQKAELREQDDTLGLFSLGAFTRLAPADEASPDALSAEGMRYIRVVAALTVGAIVVTLLVSIYLRKKMMEDANKIEALATTPADFTLLGHCKEFSKDCDYS